MPKKLTADNGAKGALSGEFSESKTINCPECLGDDECETCDGSGLIKVEVPVSWTTIKAIWAKGVEHFAAAPQPPADDLASLISQKRIAVTPEYEGQWHADVYGEEATPIQHGEGKTPIEAVRAALSAP